MIDFSKMDQMAAPRNPFLTNGDYTLEFVGAEEGRNFKDKKAYFRVTAKVVNSTGPDALPEGTVVTIKIDEDTQYNFHLKDIRNLAAAIVGVPESKVNGALVQGLMAAETPAVGAQFQARRGLFSSDKGRVFGATRFAPVGGALPALAAPETIAAQENTATKSTKRR